METGFIAGGRGWVITIRIRIKRKRKARMRRG
jgi:hypothetical protein